MLVMSIILFSNVCKFLSFFPSFIPYVIAGEKIRLPTVIAFIFEDLSFEIEVLEPLKNALFQFR